MSSPGNASWCISVRMSPGSTVEHSPLGVLDGQHPAGVIERRLAGAVSAPGGVRLDAGVARDVDDRGARRRGAGERCTSASGATTLTSNVRRSTSESMVVSAGSGLAPSVLALLTTSRTGPSRRAAVASCRRWSGSVMSPAIAATRVTSRELVGGDGQAVGPAGVDDEGPAVGRQPAGQGETEALRGAGDDCCAFHDSPPFEVNYRTSNS